MTAKTIMPRRDAKNILKKLRMGDPLRVKKYALSAKIDQFRCMHSVILLTGGNMGDRASRLARAREQIEKKIGPVAVASALYETAAWGNTGQPPFLNQVLQAQTTLSPEEVLEKILGIETFMGRVRTEKWGPREIDIDILFYGTTVVNGENLTIPHPEIPNRRFVLEPLAEIVPRLVHPVLGVDMKTLLERTADSLPVRRLM
jgi:2-amino-4-hydroxy-6-hydroxymethyldihydropteridine diphosphokinase